MRLRDLLLVLPCLVLCLSQPVSGQFRTINYRPIDAAFDRPLNRIVMVAVGPNQLIIYDPMAQKETGFVALPLAPSNVSVSPDGTHAAVGYNGFISYVNLTNATLEKSIPISCDVLQAIVGTGDYIYALPRRDQWTKIFVASISRGQEVTGNQSGSFYAGTVGQLSKDSKTLYLAQNGISPDHMQRYSVSGGLPAYQWDWPYHGDHSACGKLWLSEDGLRAFTACGQVFRLSDVQSQDMVYGGTMTIPSTGSGSFASRILSVAHAGAANRVVVLPSSDSSSFSSQALSSEIDLFSYDFLALAGRLLIPNLSAAGKSYQNHGRFIFVANDGTTFTLILQADGTAGFLNDYSMITGNLAGSVLNSANYWIAASAPGQIATIFGSNLATGSAVAESLPLPTTLAGTQITIASQGGASVVAPLFFVSPSQINFLIPSSVPAGNAKLTVSVNGQSVVSTALVTEGVAPGLYSANGDGQGAAAGLAITTGQGGATVISNTFQFNSQNRTYVTNPIPYSNTTNPAYLSLFGTGFRNARNSVTATIVGVSVPVTYAGAQGGYEGLDQVNIGPLPRGLQTFTDVSIVLTVDDKASNAVTIRLQ